MFLNIYSIIYIVQKNMIFIFIDVFIIIHSSNFYGFWYVNIMFDQEKRRYCIVIYYCGLKLKITIKCLL